MIRSNPELLKQGEDEDWFLPLHYAAARSSQEVVKLLYESWPQAVQERNNMGCLPLHLAAVLNNSLEVVKLLYESWPQAVQERNNNGGFLPLHLAAASNASLEVVKFLYDPAAFRGWAQSFLGSGQVPVQFVATSAAGKEQHGASAVA
jgi:ankyrin repeat protein